MYTGKRLVYVIVLTASTMMEFLKLLLQWFFAMEKKEIRFWSTSAEKRKLRKFYFSQYLFMTLKHISDVTTYWSTHHPFTLDHINIINDIPEVPLSPWINALLKAVKRSAGTGYSVLSTDIGLRMDDLGGRPWARIRTWWGQFSGNEKKEYLQFIKQALHSQRKRSWTFQYAACIAAPWYISPIIEWESKGYIDVDLLNVLSWDIRYLFEHCFVHDVLGTTRSRVSLEDQFEKIDRNAVVKIGGCVEYIYKQK